MSTEDAMTFPELLTRGGAVGYWLVAPHPLMAERAAMLGYDYVGIDVQHGIVDYSTLVACITAVDAGGSRSVVRVSGLDRAEIGRALDAGASGVIVPMIESAAEAREAVRATHYPPVGTRSYGPVRSGLRIGPGPEATNRAVATIVMIETAGGLEQVEEIAAVPGITGLYVGPSDLSLGLGASTTALDDRPSSFEPAIERIVSAASHASLACGFHCPGAEVATQRVGQGFTFTTIASELMHALEVAGRELAAFRP